MPIAEVSKVVCSAQGVQDFVDQLKAHVAAVGPLDAATVHLYTANITPDPTTTEAALQEVVVGQWAEYAAVAVAGWGAKDVRPDGSTQVVATNLASWTGPAAGNGPTIHGAYVKSVATGTHYLYALPFTTPIGMADATKQLDLVVPFILGGGPFSE